MLTLADVFTALTGSSPQQAAAHPITSVVIHSNRAVAGSLFVALRGEQADGHDFVAHAFANGAIAAIIDRPVNAPCFAVHQRRPRFTAGWQPPVCITVQNSLLGLQQLAAHWRSRFSPTVIGITGSVGKTSTKELAHAVLSQKYSTLKNPGNLNNEIGLPLTLLKLDQTHQTVVLEMGMYDIGEIETLCRIARPQVGVITNIGPSHLERLGTLERIVQAKQELAQALPPEGTAILNADDPRVMAMQRHTQANIFTYGLSNAADLWADNITGQGLEGIRFAFHYRGETIHVKVPLLGRHSVHTALRAAAVGLTQGLHWEHIITGLQNKQAELRLVAIPGPNGAIILDDTYNASPASTIAALNLLHELTARRKIAVLGYMAELGPYEEEGHRKVGCRAAGIVNLLITVGPKTNLIASEAIACGLPPQAVKPMQTTAQTLDYLKQHAQRGDTILIKGSRSMAMDTIVEGLSAAAEKGARN